MASECVTLVKNSSNCSDLFYFLKKIRRKSTDPFCHSIVVSWQGGGRLSNGI